MQTLDIIDTLIGGPFGPFIYHIRLGRNSIYSGLPFIVAAGMFLLVFGSVEICKVAVIGNVEP